MLRFQTDKHETLSLCHAEYEPTKATMVASPAAEQSPWQCLQGMQKQQQPRVAITLNPMGGSTRARELPFLFLDCAATALASSHACPFLLQVYSLGCIMYECLAGQVCGRVRHLGQGETVLFHKGNWLKKRPSRGGACEVERWGSRRSRGVESGCSCCGSDC